MTVTNVNIPIVHRKTRQYMTPAPLASVTGSFIVTDLFEKLNIALYIINATTHYLYHNNEDGWVQIPSGALAGTFGAGACGACGRWSTTITANGGTTTTVTTATTINGLAKGKTIRFLTGSQAGKEAIVLSVNSNPGGTSTITFDTTLSGAIVNTDTFAIDSGRFYILCPGTLASGSFKSYDPLLGVWTTLVNTGLPATWGTDGKLIVTPSNNVLATGTATAGASTTLTNSGKSRTVNQWTNMQIRITAGTGIGQVRNIASNTGTVITVSSAWTVNPDATSVYEISGNDDYIYLMGNNAVTMYRYSISANTWSTLSPGVARAGAPAGGMSANRIPTVDDTIRDNENAISAGRYIYSFRGASGVLDRYDIVANTWANIAYSGLVETFGIGSGYSVVGKYIYIRKDATHRFFKYSITGAYIEPLNTLQFPDGAAVIGNKMRTVKYSEGGVVKIKWLYSIRNSGSELFRMMLF